MKIKNTAERRFFVFVTYIFSMFKSSYGKKGKDDVLKKSLAAALIAGLFLFALCGKFLLTGPPAGCIMMISN